MTTQQYIDKINRSLQALQGFKDQYSIVNGLISMQRKRIFDEAKGTDGSPFGTYTDNAYLKYKQKRNKATTGTSVNLWLENNFQAAFINAGKNAIVKLNGDNLNVTAEVQAGANNPEGKLHGIFERYPDAFGLSEDEQDYLVRKQLEILKKSFRI